VKRGAGHPLALAVKAVSKSYAREICWWTDKLPEESRQAADEILLGAAASGLELADLAGLAGEMYERSRLGKPDDEGPDGDSDGEDGGPETGPDDESLVTQDSHRTPGRGARDLVRLDQLALSRDTAVGRYWPDKIRRLRSLTYACQRMLKECFMS
jgi:hypothetical protein